VIHLGTEAPSKLIHEELTNEIIGSATEVHRVRGACAMKLKRLEHFLPVHETQLLTYSKLTGKQIGLILYFFTAALARAGIGRKVL
jgi:hypothetical protein